MCNSVNDQIALERNVSVFPLSKYYSSKYCLMFTNVLYSASQLLEIGLSLINLGCFCFLSLILYLKANISNRDASGYGLYKFCITSWMTRYSGSLCYTVQLLAFRLFTWSNSAISKSLRRWVLVRMLFTVGFSCQYPGKRHFLVSYLLEKLHYFKYIWLIFFFDCIKTRYRKSVFRKVER